ncbi:tetratricopeptide repeat protein [Paracoccus fontiphilus]
MKWTPERNRAARQTQAYAERGLELDPLDPFANLAEGRPFLLLNRPENGQLWLDRSAQLSPSYAKGYHSPGLAAMLAGRVGECLADMERAMTLSPLDPMLCAMQACEAITLHVAGRPDEAVIWANKGARAPHAHIAMLMAAVAVCRLAKDHALARTWKAVLRTRYPEASLHRFFTVLPFTDAGLNASTRSSGPDNRCGKFFPCAICIPPAACRCGSPAPPPARSNPAQNRPASIRLVAIKWQGWFLSGRSRTSARMRRRCAGHCRVVR